MARGILHSKENPTANFLNSYYTTFAELHKYYMYDNIYNISVIPNKSQKGMIMTDKDLLYIKTVADEKGISPAAKKLFISQPSLSQSVKRIETSLNVPLFRRTPRGLLLTPEGEEYYRMASRVLSLYSAFEENLQNIQELKTGTVSIGTTPHQGLRMLPKFLAGFHIKYPGITVNVREGTAADLQRMILSGEIDLALMREYGAEASLKNISTKGFFRTSFLLLLPSGHPAGKHAFFKKDAPLPFLDPKWLRDENFLLPDISHRLRQIVLEILRNAGIQTPKSNYSSIYTETLALLASAGQGVAILPALNFSQYAFLKAPDCYSIPEEYGTFWNISLITLKDIVLSRAATVFLEELSLYMADYN